MTVIVRRNQSITLPKIANLRLHLQPASVIKETFHNFNYIQTRVPRGHSSCSRGCAYKLLITIKRFLFTALKNINHSQSYEQSKNRTSITNLLQHVHVHVTMYPLTTISYITYSVVNTPMYLIAICTWAPLISMVIFRYTHEIANYIYDQRTQRALQLFEGRS